jgi:hypothetical protein
MRTWTVTQAWPPLLQDLPQLQPAQRSPRELVPHCLWPPSGRLASVLFLRHSWHMSTPGRLPLLLVPFTQLLV